MGKRLSRYTLQYRSVAFNQSGFSVGGAVLVAGDVDGKTERGAITFLEDCGTHVRVGVRHAERETVWRLPASGEGEELADESVVPPTGPPLATAPMSKKSKR